MVGSGNVDDPRVALLSATGSTRMGQIVGPRVAARFGRTLLELGGNNAAVVTASADLELAARAIVFGAAGTAGQRCTTQRRVIVHAGVSDALWPRLEYAAAFLRDKGFEAELGECLRSPSHVSAPRHERAAELLRMLIEVGFDPMVAHQPAPGAAAGCMSSDAEASTVLLHRHCPFLEVARTHPDVVCSLHLGLIQGALDSLDAPISAGPLIPFARPEGCELTIRRAGSDTPTTPSSRPSPPTTT